MNEIVTGRTETEAYGPGNATDRAWMLSFPQLHPARNAAYFATEAEARKVQGLVFCAFLFAWNNETAKWENR